MVLLLLIYLADKADNLKFFQRKMAAGAHIMVIVKTLSIRKIAIINLICTFAKLQMA